MPPKAARAKRAMPEPAVAPEPEPEPKRVAPELKPEPKAALIESDAIVHIYDPKSLIHMAEFVGAKGDVLELELTCKESSAALALHGEYIQTIYTNSHLRLEASDVVAKEKHIVVNVVANVFITALKDHQKGDVGLVMTIDIADSSVGFESMRGLAKKRTKIRLTDTTLVKEEGIEEKLIKDVDFYIPLSLLQDIVTEAHRDKAEYIQIQLFEESKLASNKVSSSSKELFRSMAQIVYTAATASDVKLQYYGIMNASHEAQKPDESSFAVKPPSETDMVLVTSKFLNVNLFGTFIKAITAPPKDKAADVVVLVGMTKPPLGSDVVDTVSIVCKWRPGMAISGSFAPMVDLG